MEKRTYNIIDFTALDLYISDMKLHAACDQADSGFWYKKAYEAQFAGLNCHRVWDAMSPPIKLLYQNLARASIFEDVEVSCLPASYFENKAA